MDVEISTYHYLMYAIIMYKNVYPMNADYIS